MNILVFSWRDPKHPQAGGAEQVMHEHMKGWIDAGHEVTLFSSHFKNAKRRELVDGIQIIRRGYQIWGVHIAAFFWYLLIQNKTFDLVIDQFHGIPFFTPLYVRKPKLAVIQEVARDVWLKNPLPKPFNWAIGWIGYIGEPLLFLPYRTTKFMTGSKSAKAELQKMGIAENNITIIPHGVILDIPKENLTKEKTRTVMFLGVLTEDKGITDALKSFAHLNKFGGYNFWVVGKVDTQNLKRLKEITIKLGIQKKVTFYGFISDKKKFQLLSRAHLLINPSIREGWGLVNIEANSVGTPVIAYNSPGLTDSVVNNKTGIICKKNTPKQIAKAVNNLLNNESKYAKLQKGSIAWSKTFSWKKSRAESLKIIDSITKDK